MKNDKISFVCTDSFDYLLIHLNKMIQKTNSTYYLHTLPFTLTKKKRNKERKKPRDIVIVEYMKYNQSIQK